MPDSDPVELTVDDVDVLSLLLELAIDDENFETELERSTGTAVAKELIGWYSVTSLTSDV